MRPTSTNGDLRFTYGATRFGVSEGPIAESPFKLD
jgi:hypothetical protein